MNYLKRYIWIEAEIWPSSLGDGEMAREVIELDNTVISVFPTGGVHTSGFQLNMR